MNDNELKRIEQEYDLLTALLREGSILAVHHTAKEAARILQEKL